jgi:hypothetical protein
VDGKLPDNVPSAVRETWEHFHGMFVPKEVHAQVKEVYERGAKHGRCMLCEKQVGETATVVVNNLGITELYCSHLCLADMYIKGWMEETYDEMKERVEIRAITNADGSPSGE